MNIKTEVGQEINISAEELRHFKIDNAIQLREFVDTVLPRSLKKMGFNPKKKDE